MKRQMALAAALALAATSCDRSGGEAAGTAASSTEPAEGAREARDRMAEMDRDRPPRPTKAPPLNSRPPPVKISASHVLLQFAGSERSKATRTEAEARELAQKVLDRVRKGESLATIASELSDCPSKTKGGYLETFEPGKMVPAFSKALVTVAPGEVVPEVVETAFGFHVIQREPVMHLGHVLVQFREARRVHEGITRSRDEGRAEIERVRELLVAEGADWGAIARERSDCRISKLVGGDLGSFGREARLLPEMQKATGRLQPGELSEVIETEYGFHVMWRFPEGASSAAPGPEAGGGPGPGADVAAPAPPAPGGEG